MPKDTNKKLKTIAIVSLILGLLIFALAYISILNNEYLHRLNQPILDWCLQARQPFITGLVKLLTNFASSTTLIVITVAIAAIFILYKKEFLRPSLLLGSMFGVAGVATLMKLAIMDPRPLQQHMVPTYQLDYSFPSGHTLGIWTFMLVIGYLFYSRNFSIKKCIFWNLLAMLITIIIATTRLYLGYHWLTDVVASIGLGLIIFSIVIFVDRFIVTSSNTDQ